MTFLAELWRRFRFFFARDRYAAELEEEMRLHLELREARLREQGLTARAARTGARRRFGNATNIQERSRDMWGLEPLDELRADLRFAYRRLRRRPGFAIAAITVVALGIGASSAVFSAIDAALIRPLPFARPDELVTLTDIQVPFDMSGMRPLGGKSSPAPRTAAPHAIELGDVAEMHDLFAGVAAYASGGLNLEDAQNPRRLNVGVVTPNFFSTLGVGLRHGRTFTADEGRPHGAHVVVISDAFWHNALSGAPDVLGRTLKLSGTRYTIVGIEQPNFNFPNESDLWIPLSVPVTMETFAAFRGFLPSHVIGRLSPGVTMQAAEGRLSARWTANLVAPDGKVWPNFTRALATIREKGALVPLRQELVGDRRQALLLLVAATALLLLIACANVANLLLSDAASRRREVALREVLGASRLRIVRQLLVESLALALTGAVAGLLLAPLVLSALRALLPSDLAGVAPVQLDLRVLGFAAALAVVTGLAFGVWPALSAVRDDPTATIKSGGGIGATAGGMGRARRAIITIELALTVMLLVGAGLMLRSLQTVMSRVVGMDPTRVGVAQLSMINGHGPTVNRAAVRTMLERLKSEPGIQSAAAVNDLPLSKDGGISLGITVDGSPANQSSAQPTFARYLITSADYFKTMGIPFVAGRGFLASDDSSAPQVAVINEAMARRFWPNQNAVGRTFGIGGPVAVIGVVANLHERALEDSVSPQMYLSMDQQGLTNLALVARGDLPPNVLLARLNDAVHAVDRTQAVYGARMMDDIISASELPRRTNTLLITLFGAVALALSAFGVYAVLSFSVARRAREFGIRAALGATARDTALLVGGEMAGLVVAGIGLGVVGAWVLSRLMASLLFGVTAHDPATFVTVPFVLLVPALFAAIVPAAKAMRVDPTEVMRAE